MEHEKSIKLPWILERNPPPFEGNDIKSPESLTRYVLEGYSKKGAKVFDPFFGLGTNMFVAEDIERNPFGTEVEPEKYEWVAGQLENWTQMICDDAGRLNRYDLPKMDLITTCPPFMQKTDKWNPLYGGNPKYDGYDKYLRRMKFIFSKLPSLMKKNTPLIVQLDNIQTKRGFTPLIHDIANVLNKDFVQTGESVVQWEEKGGSLKPGYPHTTLLYFKKR